jgi:hypothetical protein
MGHLDEEVMAQVNNAIAVSFGLHEGVRSSPHDMPGAAASVEPNQAKG